MEHSERLEEAVKMSKMLMWKTSFKVEYARCLFKLSQALAHDKSNTQHRMRETLQHEAEKLLLEQYPHVERPVDESGYDSRVYIQWR